jgi:hypothetical protein
MAIQSFSSQNNLLKFPLQLIVIKTKFCSPSPPIISEYFSLISQPRRIFIRENFNYHIKSKTIRILFLDRYWGGRAIAGSTSLGVESCTTNLHNFAKVALEKKKIMGSHTIK